METIPLRTKKQIVLSRLIYDYIINGLDDSLSSLSQQDLEIFSMKVNTQAITHAIDISQEKEITDFNYCFDDVGISFNATIPLSKVDFTPIFIEERIELMREELGEDFQHMVAYLQKMETIVI